MAFGITDLIIFFQQALVVDVIVKWNIDAHATVEHGDVAPIGQERRHLLLDLAPDGVLGLAQDIQIDLKCKRSTAMANEPENEYGHPGKYGVVHQTLKALGAERPAP